MKKRYLKKEKSQKSEHIEITRNTKGTERRLIVIKISKEL